MCILVFGKPGGIAYGLEIDCFSLVFQRILFQLCFRHGVFIVAIEVIVNDLGSKAGALLAILLVGVERNLADLEFAVVFTGIQRFNPGIKHPETSKRTCQPDYREKTVTSVDVFYFELPGNTQAERHFFDGNVVFM